MYRTKTATFFVLLLCPFAARAEDSSALYKAKCANCHGPNGAGRSAMKGTNLLTDEAKKLSDADLAEAIAQGGKRRSSAHAYEKKGLTPQQVKLLADFVRALQKK